MHYAYEILRIYKSPLDSNNVLDWISIHDGKPIST